jgi:hypothetical protein
MKEGVAVPLLFRVALTSDAKDYLKQHKTRRLWTLPVRQAVKVAKGEIEAPAAYRTGQRAKRERVDADGDAVMVRAASMGVLLSCICWHGVDLRRRHCSAVRPPQCFSTDVLMMTRGQEP